MELLKLTQEQELKLQEIASKIIGKPYSFGAEVKLSDPPEKITSIDCSELIEYLFYQIGIKVPDGSYNQYDVSEEVKIEEAKIGDLLFTKKQGKVNHVAMVISQEKVIEASGWDKMVISQGIGSFIRFYAPNPKRPLKSQFAGVRRLIAEKVGKV